MSEPVLNRPKKSKAQIIMAVAERLAKGLPTGDAELVLAQIHQKLAARKYQKEKK